MKKSIQTLFLLMLAVHISLGINTSSLATNDNIVTVKVKGDFMDMAANVRAAITGKGINISNIVHASQMLNRTGPAFGYNNNVYRDAETYEFCSARISHKLARIHPDNIVMCPFTISVYVLSDEPEFVRLSYRIPTGKPGTEAIVEEIGELIQSIIEEATW
ncbi:MAG: DUF302 domain-containing protein [Gammaproteobacteria bacterium]